MPVAIGQTRDVLVRGPGRFPEIREALGRDGWVGLDLETTGLDPHRDRIRLLSLASGDDCWVVDCYSVDPRPLLDDLAGRRITGHNLAFDLAFLRKAAGFEAGQVADTYLLARLLSSGLETARGYHGLGECVRRELGWQLAKDLQTSNWAGALSEEQVEYAGKDAWATLRLLDRLEERIGREGLAEAAAAEHRCLPAVVWLSLSGVPLDAERWSALLDEAQVEARRASDELDALAPKPPGLDLGLGWRWDSTEEAREALAAAGCAVPDTRDETLAGVDHPLAAGLRRYRAASRRVQAFGESWLSQVSGGRVYPEWRQIGANSGRMSCRNPNLQQLPRDPRYRACVAAPPGRALVKADYSQIELRIAARISGDAAMLKAYRSGEDLHILTARAITGREDVTREERQLAKALNFGLLYGMGADGLRVYAGSQYGVPLTDPQARAYRDAFFRAYPGLRRWHRSHREGEAETRTLLGRRCLQVSRYTEKLNLPVQGSGADGLKLALALLWERRAKCPGAFPILACHDEIVVECDAERAEETAAWLRQAMTEGMAPLIQPVPVQVEVQAGPTWA